MKFNGKNIIFDDDITLTAGGFEGKKLSEVLGELQSKTSKLESYMKWLYQYGGVGGSGGGGGGSSQSGYSLYVTLGGVQITNGTLNLSSGEDEWYDLVVKVQNPEGATIRLGYTYYYLNNQGIKIKGGYDKDVKPIVLNSANSYTYTAKIRINCNERFLIDAIDDLFAVDKQINCNIVTNNYTFNAYLAKKDGSKWSESINNPGSYEIFAEEARGNGSIDDGQLWLAIEYDIAVQAKVNYNWSFTVKDKSYPYQGSGSLSEGTPVADKLMIPLIFDKNNGSDYFLANESDAGYYSLSVSITPQIIGQQADKPWTKALSFNLIPMNLYLLVSTPGGSIYSHPQAEGSGRHEFNPGTIGFRLNSYQGNSGGVGCTISYRVDGEGNWKNKPSTIRSEVDITDVNITDTSRTEHFIEFKLTCGSSEYPSNGTTAKYYFYVKPFETNINYPWADEGSNREGTFNIYRGGKYGSNYDKTQKKLVGNAFKSLYDLNGGAPYQHSSGRSAITINNSTYPDNITYPNTGSFTTIINIGLQYSEVNDDNATILTAVRGGESDNYLTIKQNSITFGTDATVSYYLPKTDYGSFAGSNNNEYHLLSIVYRLVNKTGNNYLYEIVVFVDGIMEGAAGNYVSFPLTIENFTIQPCNCIFNLFEISYLTWNQSNGVEDINIYQYWLSYKSLILAKEIGNYDISIIDEVSKFSITNDGFVFTEDRDSVANIAQMCGVPSLIMTIQDNNNSVLDAICTGYDDDNTPLPFAVSLEWSDGKNPLDSIVVPSTMPNAQFFIDLQGSSTRKYKCKNWSLRLVNQSGDEKQVARYLFSPNFSKTDSNTFLPEQEFTLKADVVDSSHSNNTSIGRFVNDITSRFNTGQTGVLKDYIKNCLDGFPIIVYICLARTENDATVKKYYYQGVYNFNLGRSSYYNLGYKNTNVFCDGANVLLDNASSGFSFYQVDPNDDNMLEGLVVAEIQGNSPYFDFSQSDKSILFQQSSNDREYMFGDIEHYSGITDAQTQDILVNLVEKTSKAGGYIFETVLKKTISNSEDDMYGYLYGYNATLENGKPANQVPNYKKRMVKRNVDSAYRFFVEEGAEDKQSAGPLDVEEFIGDAEDPVTTPGFFDYQSLSEYYTICMAFGLVDSVQKNMNIKSWNARINGSTCSGKFYAAFYDMDTCLGINNAGKDTTYFAFSDYWDHDDSNVVNGVIKPSHVMIYRDYSPKNRSDEEGGGDYYDTASSYLFAVAKYAIYLNGTNSLTTYWPKRLWALWRSNANIGEKGAGCLSSAKTWMARYFQNNLGKVSIPLINMNYRNKYFVFTQNEEDLTTPNNSFSKRNFSMFNGTRIHKAADWLNGRFHVLDAYFNLPDANSPIQYYNSNGEFVDLPVSGDSTEIVVEPSLGTNTYNLRNNPDISVLQDIFTQGTSDNSGSGTIDINIKAREFTPLFISSTTRSFRYLLSANKTYNIYQDLSGLQAFTFGGSANWVELDSINSLPFSSLYVNSRYLQNLNGSLGTLTINGSDIIMPSLKQMALTGVNYNINFNGEGAITYEKYPNLVEVNVSRVKTCNLAIDGSNLTSLDLSNVLSGSVSLSSCGDLQTLTLGSGTQANPSPILDRLSINPLNGKINNNNLVFNYTAIREIDLNNTSTRGNSKISISNDEAVRTIRLTGFSEISITNCPNVEEIIISDPNGSSTGDFLTKITINKVGDQKLDKFKINSDTPGIIDLTNCKHLTNVVSLSNLPGITDVKMDSDNPVVLEGSCFINNGAMRYLTGRCQFNLHGTSIFQNCKVFTRTGSDESYTNLFVPADVTSLANTFYCSDGSSGITLANIKEFFSENRHWSDRSKITNMSNMFHGQGNIKYDQSNLIYDLTNNTYSGIDLSGFTKLSTVTGMFSWTGISAYHKKLLSFGSDISSITFTNFTIGSESIAIFEDSFKNIISKIDGTFGNDNVNYNQTYTLITKSGSTYGTTGTPVLKNYFVGKDDRNNNVKPEKITAFRSFNLNTSQNINIANFFSSSTEMFFPKMTSMYCVFRNQGSRVSGWDQCGLNRLQTSITFYESLNFTTSTAIDWWSFLNWEKILQIAYPFQNRQDQYSMYDLGCLTFNKKLTMDGWNNLWLEIIRGKNTSLSYFFRNCTLEGASSDRLDVLVPSGEDVKTRFSTITRFACAFRNFKIIRQGTTSATPIKIGKLFHSFPAVTNFHGAFAETNIGEFLFRNFFGKRTIDTVNSGVVYFCTGTPVSSVDPETNDTESVIWEHKNNNASIFKEGTVTKFKYTGTNMILDRMFYNCIWERDPNNDEYASSARCYHPDQDDTEILPNYFTIEGIDHQNGEEGYQINSSGNTITYNRVKVTVPKREDDGTEIDPETGEEVPKYKWTNYDYYKYEVKNAVVTGTENSEISDLNGLEGSSYHKDNFKSKTGDHNIKNTTIDNADCLFIAPDFFYAVNNTTSSSIKNIFTPISNDDPTTRLEGMIPQNLFKNCKSLSFEGTFTNLNITPRFWRQIEQGNDRVNIYVYVPQNFTTCTSLGNSFKFTLNVPDPGLPQEYAKFYVMFKNSIPKGTSTLSNSLPNSWLGPDNWPNFGYGNNDLGSHYNIMIDSARTNDISEGIDTSYFNSLTFNNLVTGRLSWVLHGYLFNTGFLVESLESRLNRNNDGVIVEYAIYTTAYKDNATYISRHLILPKTNKNASDSLINSHLISFSTTGGITIGRSQIESCTDAAAAAYETIPASSGNTTIHIHVVS